MKTIRTKGLPPFFLLVFLFFSTAGFSQNGCCNILTNGDFEAGNTGFTSGLPLNCTCVAGSYCVGPNFTTKCPGQWPSLTDHTTGSGKFLIIDGNPNTAADVWRNTVTVTKQQDYCFSFWAATVYETPFDLGVTINGSLVPGGTITIGQFPPTWANYSLSINLAPGTYVLAIRQLTGGSVRDFGLDDIVFGGPLVANFLFSPELACGMTVDFFNQSTGPGALTYQWNFGDPASGVANTSTAQNPKHTFSGCGDFQVCLTVTKGSCVETFCQTVTVIDDEPPKAKCLGVGIELNGNCQGTVTPGLINDGSTDNCSIASMTVSPSVLTGCGLFPVTLTVTDICGNTSTCSTMVQTIETVPPSITCPANISVQGHLNDLGCSGQIKLPYVTATDNCDTSVAITNNGPGIFFPSGSTTVVYTATDDCGNTATCSYTVTVLPCDTMCLCPNGAVSGPNLVQNGDFSAGNAGFTSDYLYSTVNPLSEGKYWIGTNPNAIHGNFQPCTDHTTGTGNMMVVNGAGTPNTNVWCQTIPVDPNSNYNFCTWVATVVGASPAYLQFSINGVNLGGGFLAPSTTCNWLQFNQSWNSGGASSATICIVNQNTTPAGNDFALDDISFRKCSGSNPPVCDSVSAFLQSVSGIPANQCCLKLETNNIAPAFFNHIEVTLSSGTFANSTVNPGWTSTGSGNTLTLSPASGGFIPVGPNNPITICNPGGANPHILSVKFLYGPAPQHYCEKVLDFNCFTVPMDTPCPKNIVLNSGFKDGAVAGNLGSNGSANHWTTATGTPQVVPSDYCCDPVSIQMWGNKNKGESICQAIPPTFIQGHTYCITYCARFVDIVDLPTKYVRFGFTATNGCTTDPFTCTTPSCEGMGNSGPIGYQSWGNYTFKWTAQNNWTSLNIRAFNDNPDIPGTNTTVSFGRIDCICIEDVTEPCLAAFNFNLINNCGKVQFTNTSTGPQPLTYSWNFGDNTPGSNQQDPMHQYTTCGTYTVCLTLSGNGCTSSVCRNVIIEDNIPPVITCRPDTTVFAKVLPCSAIVNGLKYLSVSDNCSYQTPVYVLSGATSGSGQNDPSGTVFNSGTTTVTYGVKDWCGKLAGCSFKVTVFCDTMPCACTAGSAPGSNLVTNGNFTAGDAGFTSGLTSSTNCGAGSYNVGYNFNSFCSSWPSRTDHTIPAGQFLMLDGSDNGPVPTVLWKSQVTLVPGKKYCFSFWWTSAISSPTQSFPVEIDQLDNSGNILHILGSTTIAENPAATWKQSIITFTVYTAGTNYISIRQLTGDQYRDWGIDDICLREIPDCTADISTLYNGCGKYTFTGYANGVGPFTYAWTFGDPNSGAANTSTLANPMHQFASAGPHVVTLVVTDATGCSVSYSTTINATFALSVAIQGNLSICSGSSTALTAAVSGNSGPYTYIWAPAGQITPSINVNPLINTTYTVTLTDSNGCTSTSSATVTVKPVPAASAGPDVSICSGQTAALTATGGGTYAWTNGPSTAQYNVTPTATSTYTVVVTDPQGCTASDQVTVKVNNCDCPGSILQNGSFVTGIAPGNLGGSGTASSWSPIYTPQVVTSDGYKQNGCMQMWGNLVVGEGIRQPVIFQPNCTYKIDYAAKNLNIGVQQNVGVSFWATNGPTVLTHTNYRPVTSNASLIGDSPALTTSWNYYLNTITWTAPSFPPMTQLVATVRNNSSISLPSQISWVRLDSICVTLLSCPSDPACGPFVNMGFGYEKGAFVPAVCDNPDPVVLTCPNPGQKFNFTGKFTCTLGGITGSEPVKWELWHNGSFTGVAGSTNTTPFVYYFGIPLYASYFTAGGVYELRLAGLCGEVKCPCIIKFQIPACVDPCPCSELQHETAKGFYKTSRPNQCKVCFTPIALRDCDRVEWSIDPVDTSGTNPAGITYGNRSFCFNFWKHLGTYTITMHVYRPRPDGTFCEAIFYKKINVNCDKFTDCTNPVFLNPGFDQGSGAGDLGNGGHTSDWAKVSGNPVITDLSAPGTDGWSVQLGGNNDGSDAIQTINSYCLNKDTGTITIRAKILEPNSNNNPMLFVNLVRGDNPITSPCSGDKCFEIACLQFPEDADDWIEFQFDYNLDSIPPVVVDTSCHNVTAKPAVQVRPVIYVANWLRDAQGGADTYSKVLIDNICLSGADKGAVPVKTPSGPVNLRIYPNPNDGRFSIDMPVPGADGMKLRVTDATGRLVMEQNALPGLPRQIIDGQKLANGLYFLQIVSEGKVIGVEKFVKQ